MALLPYGCTTEKELEGHFGPARESLKQLSLGISQMNILQALVMGQDQYILSPLLKIEHFDTQVLDGDVYQSTILFVCGGRLGDGIEREGK